MIWMIGVCAICFLVCMPLYLYYKRNLVLHLAVAFKSLGTLCAFLLALIAAIRLEPRCYIAAGALLIYAAADVLLEYSFMLGAGFFLAGHIFSTAFFLNLYPVSASHAILMILLLLSMFFVFWRWRKQIGKQMPVFSVYGIILCAMAASAVSCFMLHNSIGTLIACGGALFFLSDFMILRRLLFPSGTSYDWAIMITYYASLLMIGIACLQF